MKVTFSVRIMMLFLLCQTDSIINWLPLLVQVSTLSSTSSVGHIRGATLCSTTLMFTITLLISSSISVALTIHTPVLLNRTIISCQGQTLTLHVLSSKLLLAIYRFIYLNDSNNFIR